MRKLLAVILVAAMCLPAYGVSLNYSDHEPLGNMRTKFLNDVFFPAVGRESHGRIKIIPHWDGKLSISYNALDTLRDGSTVQLSVIVPEYFMKYMLLHQVFKSFPAGPSCQRQVDFFRRVYDEIPSLAHELEAVNIQPVFIATGYPAAFFSVKPLSSLGELKGQRWRSASFWHKDFLANAGAEPVTIPWGKGVFDALADGSLDGLIVNIDSGYDIGAYKAAKYILVSPELWLGHEYIIAMNKECWDKLDESDREAISRAAEYSYSLLGEVMVKSLPEIIAMLEAEGADVRLLADEEVRAWEAMSDYRAAQSKWEAVTPGAEGLADEVRRVMNSLLAE